jgi:hypothetical protein
MRTGVAFGQWKIPPVFTACDAETITRQITSKSVTEYARRTSFSAWLRIKSLNPNILSEETVHHVWYFEKSYVTCHNNDRCDFNQRFGRFVRHNRKRVAPDSKLLRLDEF